MSLTRVIACAIAIAYAVDVPAAHAQRLPPAPRFASDGRTPAAAERAVRAPGLRPIAIAKWTALAGAVAAAAYGFARNGEADDLFAELERECEADRARCRQRTPSGAYVDASLEALYQEVLDHDRVSRRALLGSQVGIAAGIALFLLDLRPGERPPDIPYDPPRLDVGPRDGSGLFVRATLPFGTARPVR